MRWKLLALALPLAACLVGAVVAIAGRGGDPAFQFRQSTFQRLSTPAVDALVGTAPDPRGNQRPKGVARCRPGTSGDLRNPWRCTIVYTGRFRTRYLVTVHPDGSYVGRRLDQPGEITGCCTALQSVG